MTRFDPIRQWPGSAFRRTEVATARRAVAALCAGLFLTAVATIAAVDVVDDRRTAADELVAQQTRARIQEQLEEVVTVTTVARNALMARDEVAVDDFLAAAALDRADGILDGVAAISFVRAVERGAVPGYERLLRESGRAGTTDFTVRPAGTDHDVRWIVEAIEPLASNEAALGFDIGSEPVRRAAIEAARDLGEPAATGPITLVQGDAEVPAVLVLLPTYDTDTVPVTGPARRRHVTGMVSVVVRVRDLVAAAVGVRDRVPLSIHDVGPTVAAEAGASPPILLLQQGVSGVPDRADPGAETQAPGPVPTGAQRALDLDVGGRRWRLVVDPSRPLDPLEVLAPVLALMLGLTGSVLLATTISREARARAKAEAIAAALTADLRAMLAGAPDPTLVVAADGSVLFASDEVESLMGLEAGELVGTPVSDLVGPPAQPVTRADAADDEVGDSLLTDGRGAWQVDGEAHVRRSDGEIVEVEVRSNTLPSRVEDVDGPRIVLSLRDARERRAAERARDALDRQRQAFLRTITHELRTPLVAITGFVRLLRSDTGRFSAEQRDDFMARIERNGTGLHRLVEDVIDFALLERGESELRLGAHDIGRLVRDVVDQLTPVLDGHELRCAPPPTGVVANVDPEAVTRVLSNLLVNAGRYSPPGTAVTVSVEVRDGAVAVRVDDEGPGVPATERASIFERFVRGSGSHVDAAPGTGIGLAVVTEIVAQHGGSVSVGDAPSGGARFEVVLPTVSGGRQPATSAASHVLTTMGSGRRDGRGNG